MSNRPPLQQTCAHFLKKVPPTVRLIAASKTRSLAEVQQAFAAGITHFGENYVQEGVAKARALPEATWHFIGKLQKNKVNQAIEAFSVFHTVDSEALLNKLNNAAARAGVRPEIFIQVNLAHEPQKGGCASEDLGQLVEGAQQCKNLKLVGLMTLPPADQDPTPYFETLAQLAKQHNLPRLSMGMSGDWEKAVAHGATDVRLGSVLFGDRG